MDRGNLIVGVYMSKASVGVVAEGIDPVVAEGSEFNVVAVGVARLSLMYELRAYRK